MQKSHKKASLKSVQPDRLPVRIFLRHGSQVESEVEVMKSLPGPDSHEAVATPTCRLALLGAVTRASKHFAQSLPNLAFGHCISLPGTFFLSQLSHEPPVYRRCHYCWFCWRGTSQTLTFVIRHNIDIAEHLLMQNPIIIQTLWPWTMRDSENSEIMLKITPLMMRCVQKLLRCREYLSE